MRIERSGQAGPRVDHVSELTSLLSKTAEAARPAAVGGYIEAHPELVSNPALAARALTHAATRLHLDAGELQTLRSFVATGLLEAIAQAAPMHDPALIPAAVPVSATLEELRFSPKLPADFISTASVSPNPDIYVGQDRVKAALSFGLQQSAPGYNIFISGPLGRGALTSLTNEVQVAAATRPVPKDLVLLPNFSEPQRPQTLWLPAGAGQKFTKALEGLIATLSLSLADDVEREEAARQKDGAAEIAPQTDMSARLSKFGESVAALAEKQGIVVELVRQEEGFGIGVTGFRVARDLLSPEVLSSLRPDERNKVEAALSRGEATPAVSTEVMRFLPQASQADLQRRMRELGPKLEAAAKEFQAELERANEQFASQLAKRQQSVHQVVIGRYLEPIKKEFEGEAGVTAYLGALQRDLETRTAAILQLGSATGRGPAINKLQEREILNDMLERYLCKLAVDNSSTHGAPVVVLDSPTYDGLFGSIAVQGRESIPAFIAKSGARAIEPGALLKANGGYLILNLESLLQGGEYTPGFILSTLIRTLQNRKLEAETLSPATRMYGSRAIPPAIPIDVKLVVVGGEALFHEAGRLPGFNDVFRAFGDFSFVQDNTAAYSQAYASYIAHTCQSMNLPHFDRDALAAVLECAAREVSDKDKLLAISQPTIDLVHEAGRAAKAAGAQLTTAEHVKAAIARRTQMFDKHNRHFVEMRATGAINIATRGWRVGELNGLVVTGHQHARFGGPARVAVTTAMAGGAGSEAIVNIDDQSGMAGESFRKANGILAAWLRHEFGQGSPFNLRATTVMEQSYGGVDGDSATSTITYALLSSLADLPLRQDIAVTGSMDSNGRVQIIGGENAKVEGFYDLCVAQGGLTGTQGVIIPESNLKGLVLRADVQEAIAAGKFHIYPVTTVQEGIEILTGVKAGRFVPYTEAEIETIRARSRVEGAEAAARGGYWEPGTVSARVDEKLRGYASRAVQLGVAERARAEALLKDDSAPKKGPLAWLGLRSSRETSR